MTISLCRVWLAAILLLVPLSYALAKEPATGLPVGDAASVGMNAEKLAEIQKAMQAHVDAGQAAGVVSLVAKDGKVVHLSAVGIADREAKRPMKPDTLFSIASMTKPITGVALMILVDEGKVSLDDPISKYIPEFKDAKLADGSAPKRDITVRDVATHTSGVVGDQANDGSLENTGRMLAKRPLGFQPGEKWQYSPGLSIVGRVIEVASGKPYEVFLQERLFDPLGMKDTSFNPPQDVRDRLAVVYQPGRETGTLARAPKNWINDVTSERTPNPSGGLFSTAADLARFYQMVLGGGQLDGQRILSEEAVKTLTSPQTKIAVPGFTPGSSWGIGWCIVEKPQGVTEMLSPGSCGHGGAFGTQSWIDPTRDMIFIMLVQRSGFGNGDASNLRQTLQKLATDALEK